MDPSAIFGFAGVLVGTTSTYLAQRGAEVRRDQANARVGVRLVKKDLVEAREVIEIGLETEQWWHSMSFEIGFSNWHQYAGDLARGLSLSEWEGLREVIAVTESLEGRAKFIQEVERDPKMTDDDREIVASILQNVVEGEKLLDTLASELRAPRERLPALGLRRTTER